MMATESGKDNSNSMADEGENPDTPPPSSENEVLVLPSSYVPRRVKHIAPNCVSTTTTTIHVTAAASLGNGNSQQHPFIIPTSNGVTTPTTTTITTTHSSDFLRDDASSCPILKENEILTSPQTSQLSIIYSLPGFGSTSLMVSLIVKIQQNHPERWVSYMDLRRVAPFIQNSSGNDENNLTLAGLLSSYNKITLPTALQQIESFFKSSDTGGKHSILAELFLDELDELTPKMQDVLLRIIKRDVSWDNCQTRLWISSRSHLKPRLENLFPEANVYELLPLLRTEQINLLASYWKLTSCPNVADSKLHNFACGLHDQMEKLIPNFYKTIGACPSHLLQLPEFFTHIVTKLGEDMTENHFSTIDVSITKIFEKFVKTKFEAFVDKVSCEHPALAMSSVQFRDKEFRKLERIHVRAVIASYPLFKCNAKVVFAGNVQQKEQVHELYRVGICYEENGEIKFLHKMYAEFIVAQFFVDSGRLKNTSNVFISFFLNHILFDEECKTTRKFFNAYLTIQQQERHKIRDVIVWNRLRCFLVKHYRLTQEACESPSSDEYDAADDGTGNNNEQNLKLTYEDIKGNGSVIHLAIIEGHFRILQMIIDCFKGHSEEIKKILSMTVPMEIFNENPFSQPNSTCTPDIHVVDSFQMLSMYGYGSENMEKLITAWFYNFGDEYMAKYFEDGTWTVVHYAAMNSNCHFLHALLSQERKWERIQVNQRNPEGYQPIHMVLTKCWYYSIKIRDHPHPNYKSCMVRATTPSSSSKVIAEQDAEVSDAFITPADQQPVTVSSSSCPASLNDSKKPIIGKRQLGGQSLSSKKKGKIVCLKPVRTRSQSQIMKRFKDIWCFEGVDKEFSAEWDLYPEDAKWNPLQPHLTTIAQLIMTEIGGDVNAEDDVEGKTLLHQAAVLESVKLTRFLLAYGADVNARDDFEKTPAHYAVLHENMGVLDALVVQEKKNNHGFGGLNAMLKNGKGSSMMCNIC